MKKKKKYTSTKIWRQLNFLLNFIGNLSLNNSSITQEIYLVEFI